MGKDLRVEITDEAAVVLTEEADKRAVPRGKIVSAAILHMLRPQADDMETTKLDVLLAQQATVIALLNERLPPPPKDEDPPAVPATWYQPIPMVIAAAPAAAEPSGPAPNADQEGATPKRLRRFFLGKAE